MSKRPVVRESASGADASENKTKVFTNRQGDSVVDDKGAKSQDREERLLDGLAEGVVAAFTGIKKTAKKPMPEDGTLEFVQRTAEVDFSAAKAVRAAAVLRHKQEKIDRNLANQGEVEDDSELLDRTAKLSLGEQFRTSVGAFNDAFTSALLPGDMKPKAAPQRRDDASASAIHFVTGKPPQAGSQHGNDGHS